MNEQNLSKDYVITWDKMHRDAMALAALLSGKGLGKGRWRGILAITRGGMVPACIVARELGILLVDTFCISTYDDKTMGYSQILKAPAIIPGGSEGADWLVIDDLVDTGGTFRVIRQHYPKAHFACLYAKPDGKPTVDTFISEVSQDTWIHFPWEMNPA